MEECIITVIIKFAKPAFPGLAFGLALAVATTTTSTMTNVNTNSSISINSNAFYDVPLWEIATLAALILWLVIVRFLRPAAIIRSALRPRICEQVQRGVVSILRVQRMQHSSLDSLFGVLAVLVSKEFYTTFLPFLFWSGHCELARQMTLLMAFSIYIGNCVKDTISAPRPPSPPVRRLTTTDSEKDFALEYGLPSSHTINTICLSGYLLIHMIGHVDMSNIQVAALVFFFVSVTILTVLGRLYLGMHSPIDIQAGVAVGTCLLILWCTIDEALDSYIVNGSNVEYFWPSISFLLLFAYPTPDLPTPSFEFHTAFTGVALGVVMGIHRTYDKYHHEDVPNLIVLDAGVKQLLIRLLVGFPVVIAAKVISKELAKILLPPVYNFFGVPIESSSYISTPQEDNGLKEKQATLKNGGHLGKKKSLISILAAEKPFNIDTAIRLVQYTGLGWSVVELVPYIFEFLHL